MHAKVPVEVSRQEQNCSILGNNFLRWFGLRVEPSRSFRGHKHSLRCLCIPVTFCVKTGIVQLAGFNPEAKSHQGRHRVYPVEYVLGAYRRIPDYEEARSAHRWFARQTATYRCIHADLHSCACVCLCVFAHACMYMIVIVFGPRTSLATFNQPAKIPKQAKQK